ncbi:hypothetical protein A2U01_0076444, partial [Trifolium medium]|nr:hypothetical protein [Trifolium medium]
MTLSDGGKPDALRPADLNKPGTSEKQRAMEYQPNQKPRTNMLEPRSRDES